MQRIKTLLIAVALTAAAPAFASGGHALTYKFEPDSNNIQSAQRGARNFMNYCSGCHSMKHLRYGRLGQDLHIPDDLLKANLMFTTDKPGEHIVSSMPATESAKWFGQAPPDLTLETRYRGADWVYNYLMTFYVDPSRPLGVNNLTLPGASMPHVLADLQGWQVKVEEHAAEGHEEGGHGGHKGPKFELVQAGKLKPEEYKAFVTDTVNFMHYAAEPARNARISLGYKVMLYLFLFTFLAYLLKKEWWKDVH
ncbi:cytochrome c1 [Solimonas sp. K1W22B-7]|uniref:cytochrome c1 n=1 Tax=Solimonas sp. K1W22B-7 TaxID=2303331 RepID=UPI000E32FC99|nr:cytochrome c1 [Solimonas sp. K1W22B-7]AXQ28186.1 cytochrome c1 [Solimonas sp. K1W22B-7]